MIFGSFRAWAFAAMLLGLAIPAFGQDMRSAEDAQPSDIATASTDRPRQRCRPSRRSTGFAGGKNSRLPRGGVVVDSAGNVYGTTVYPSSCMQGLIVCGIVYKLTPPHGTVKTWTFKILHEFGHTLQDGIGPMARSPSSGRRSLGRPRRAPTRTAAAAKSSASRPPAPATSSSTSSAPECPTTR